MPEFSQAQTPPAAAPRASRAIVLLWAVFAAHLVAAAILVPPWQNPDEPIHFAVIRALTHKPWLDIGYRRNVDDQAAILRSMAEHAWWAAYQEPVPDPLPSNFLGVPTHMGDAASAPPLYYVAMAAYLRALRSTELLSQYYLVRLASLLMTLLTFALMLRGAYEWFGEEIALYTGAFVALVPQFALIGISVSPDPLLFLTTAVVWWQAGRLAARKGVIVPIGLMLLATAVALLAKQLAMPLLLQLPLLLLLAAVSAGRGRVAAGMAAAGGLAVVGLLLAAATSRDLAPALLRRVGSIVGWETFESSASYFVDYSWRLFESSYLVAGWQRFYPPGWLTGIALAIFAVLWMRGMWGPPVEDRDPRLRLAALAAVIVVAVQLAALYGTKYYRPGWGAQGRFLFPMIGPFATLCVLGARHRFSPAARARLCLSAVALLGLLDLIAWMTTIVPVYARWI